MVAAVAGTGLPRIVHVSGDFPDPVDGKKSPVIRSLLELTKAEFAHQVVSINRRNPRLWGAADTPLEFDWGEAIVYRAPPSGLFHATMLHRLGDRLASQLAANPPALLAGHKLAIEGLVVARAARRLGIPYTISVQGNTDTRVLAARPDLARELASVFHGAAAVFAFAPWALAAVEKRLGKRAVQSIVLACPTDLDSVVAPFGAGQGLISAFHLRNHRNKNLAGMAGALRLLQARGEGVGFTLAGAGNPQELAVCERALRGIAGAKIVGTTGRSALAGMFNRAVGFVLPSHRESFGLVFVEALFAGIPVIYPADRAIAGYFENAPFTVPVDPESRTQLAQAMRRLVLEESAMKRALHDWQTSTHALQFTRPHIAAQFAAGLRQALDRRLQFAP